MDIRQIGVLLDDPSGYLHLEQMTLGHSEATLSRVCSTGYSAAMRDDENFTFVFQRSGRYDLQISGQQFGMAPASLMAFRPNERRSQVRAGKAGVRTAATL